MENRFLFKNCSGKKSKMHEIFTECKIVQGSMGKIYNLQNMNFV